MTNFGENQISKKNTVDMEYELLRPFSHLTQVQAHHWLSDRIPDALQYWLKIPDSKLQAVKCITKMYIDYGTLFDDVQDSSLYRRTVPSAHTVYGIPLTINAVMHVFALIMEKVRDLGHPEAMNIFIEYHLQMLRGQGEDIFRRENQICPTEDEYMEMAYNKSSVVLLLFGRLMQLFSDNKIDFTKLISTCGIYYIIRDDYCSLVKQEVMEGNQRSQELQCMNDNSFCEDLTDSKFSWPVIHALQYPEGKPLLYLLRQRTRDMGLKLYYRSLLSDLGSIEYTLATLDEYDAKIRQELAELGGNPVLEELINDFKVTK